MQESEKDSFRHPFTPFSDFFRRRRMRSSLRLPSDRLHKGIRDLALGSFGPVEELSFFLKQLPTTSFLPPFLAGHQINAVCGNGSLTDQILKEILPYWMTPDGHPTDEDTKGQLKSRLFPQSIASLQKLVFKTPISDVDIVRLLSGKTRKSSQKKVDKEQLSRTSFYTLARIIVPALLGITSTVTSYSFLRDVDLSFVQSTIAYATLTAVGAVATSTAGPQFLGKKTKSSGLLGLLTGAGIGKYINQLHPALPASLVGLTTMSLTNWLMGKLPIKPVDLNIIHEKWLSSLQTIGNEMQWLFSTILNLGDSKWLTKNTRGKCAIPVKTTANQAIRDFLIAFNIQHEDLENNLDYFELFNLLCSVNYADYYCPTTQSELHQLTHDAYGHSLPLSEILLKTAGHEWIRESVMASKIKSQRTNFLPSPEHFQEFVQQRGLERLATIKMFSTDNPWLSLTIAFPTAFRFSHPELVFDGNQTSTLHDAILHGQRKNNRGNTGVIPAVILEYWSNLAKSVQGCSYLHKVITSTGEKDRLEERHLKRIHKLPAEIASSAMLPEILSTIACFVHDKTAEGPQGIVKHTAIAIDSVINSDIDKHPENLISLLNIISLINCSVKTAEIFRDNYYTDTTEQQLLNQSISNMKAVQKEISTKLLNHFLVKTPKWVILRSDLHRSYGPQSLTYFLFWMAKEKPQLINQAAPMISNLYKSSGLIGTGEQISLEYFWTFYFLYQLTSPDDSQNTINQFGIDTAEVQPFREAVLSHINGLTQDVFQSHLSLNSPRSDDQIDSNYLTQASEIIRNGANLLTYDQLNTLLTRVAQCLENIDSQISNYAQPDTNPRLRADQILKLALTLSNIAEERFTDLKTTVKAIKSKVKIVNKNIHQAEKDLVSTAIQVST